MTSVVRSRDRRGTAVRASSKHQTAALNESRPDLDAEVNSVADFAVDRFEIVAFCEDCGHAAAVDRSRFSAEITIPELCARLRCGSCRGSTVSIRIVYIGAGGFAYRAG